MHHIDSAHLRAPVFDVGKLTTQFDDRGFALEIASQFVSTFPELRAELEVCVKQEEQKQTLSFAHRLKDAADTVKADRITGIAFEMESAAQTYRQELQMRLRELLTEFENFSQAVGDNKTTFV